MKYSVITYVFNGYEKPREVINPDPDVEYIMVTDDESTKLNTWTVVVDHSLDGLSGFDKCYYVRYNCYKYCHTDICIRIDGSIEIRGSLDRLVDEFVKGDYDAAFMVHPWRCNLISEYQEWVNTRHYPVDTANYILNMLHCVGYDMHGTHGLYQLGVSIQRRGKLTDDIDRMTYAMLKYLGTEDTIERLDQTIFTFILNRYFYHMKVLPLSQRILDSDMMAIYNHGGSVQCHFNYEIMPYIDKGYLFGRITDLFS